MKYYLLWALLTGPQHIDGPYPDRGICHNRFPVIIEENDDKRFDHYMCVYADSEEHAVIRFKEIRKVLAARG